jgi:nitric oxide synthase-interacting protein
MAVATPSGHIYSKEAIVQYMLTKNTELKKQKAECERLRLDIENRRVEWETKMGKRRCDTFVKKDQGAMKISNSLVVRSSDDEPKSSTTATSAHHNAASSGGKKHENSLQHVSYWLASSQPQHVKGKGTSSNDDDFDYESEIAALPPMPPDRPPSPYSGEPLKLKQLIPLHLVHEGEENGVGSGIKNKSNNSGRRILCAVSHKAITTQPTIVLKNTGHVMLQSVYDELAKPTMTCPVTGRKFKEKDVLELVRGRSGFAASGEVMAKKYNPTLT